MKTSHYLITLVFIVLLAVPVFSADFDMDFVVFRDSENNDIAEIYLMIPRNLFEFTAIENGYQSNAFIRVAFVQGDTVRDMQEWSLVDQVNELTEISDAQRIPDIVTFSVPIGQYKIIAIVIDLTSRKTYRVEKDVNLRIFSDSELQLSDIQLSAQVSRTDTQNKFSKYFGYDIIPNASNVYGEQNPMIYGFCEAYNLSFDDSKDGKYKVKYTITDLNDNEISALDWIYKKKPGTSAVELNSINISDMNSGLYNFKITVVDEETGQQASAQERFYILKNDQDEIYKEAAKEVNLSDLTEKQLNEMFAPMRYIAGDKEVRRFKKSNVEGKRAIITQFWNHRDPDPATLVNEAQVDFNQRLQYVEQQFATPRQPGYKTDMGRVFLIYGPPSEIERFPSSIEAKPYQIWHYFEIEGGVLFVFVDKTGFGMMELVHSTARNELQDYQWQRWVSPTSSSSDQYGY
ncbi:MAG TPA: hypothetical protein DHW42_04620 [Candidatus Marinimicrobia bacterium]|nr:hypothetical protein [Candidatus Neomarinimicrobiota bacterium]